LPSTGASALADGLFVDRREIVRNEAHSASGWKGIEAEDGTTPVQRQTADLNASQRRE